MTIFGHGDSRRPWCVIMPAWRKASVNLVQYQRPRPGLEAVSRSLKNTHVYIDLDTDQGTPRRLAMTSLLPTPKV